MDESNRTLSMTQTPPPEASSAGPVAPRERIASLDVLRGVAILGIFFVNMQLFAMPFMPGIMPLDLGEQLLSEQIAWAFIKLFCEYKFISMFSLLFGAGMAMQLLRARAAGVPFAWRYVRRMIVLMILGLMHALLLWYGDILFVYACIGLWLLLFAELRPRTLFIVAACILGSLTVVTTALAALQIAFSPAYESAGRQGEVVGGTAESAEVAKSPSIDAALVELMGDESNANAETGAAVEPSSTNEAGQASPPAGADADVDAASVDSPIEDRVAKEHESVPAPLRPMADAGWDVMSQAWADAERDAYKHGPFLNAFAFRVVSFLITIPSAIFGYGWHVLAMFLIGCGLMKLDFFSPRQFRLQRTFLMIGLPVGFALEVAMVAVIVVNDHALNWSLVITTPLHELGSVPLCLGYVGAVAYGCSRGWLPWLARAFANVGRMALSNYLLETIIATTMMYWYGFGLFGDVSRPRQLALVVVIYCGLMVFSAIWLRFFRFGPFEWLWRSLTYWKLQPMLRERAKS